MWLMLDSEQRVVLLDIVPNLAKIGPKAAAVLSMISKRLAVGHEQYGDFGKSLDWKKETIEEHLDAVVYLTVALKEMSKAAG